MKAIYAIIDIVAMQIIGNSMIEASPAAAIRTFGDLASDNRTIVGAHPADFNLVCLAYINSYNGAESAQRKGDPTSGDTHAEPEIIITGKAWLATQTAAADGPKLVPEA